MKKIFFGLLLMQQTLFADQFILELKDGKKQAVILNDSEIVLSDGWNEQHIPVQNILDLKINGRVIGVVQDANGTRKKIEDLFFTNDFLDVNLVKTNEHKRFFWKDVAHISQARPSPQSLSGAIGMVVETQQMSNSELMALRDHKEITSTLGHEDLSTIPDSSETGTRTNPLSPAPLFERPLIRENLEAISLQSLGSRKIQDPLKGQIEELQLALEKEKQKNNFLLKEVNQQLPALLRRIKAKEQLLSELKQQLTDLFSHYECYQKLNRPKMVVKRQMMLEEGTGVVKTDPFTIFQPRELWYGSIRKLKPKGALVEALSNRADQPNFSDLQDKFFTEKAANTELKLMRDALLADALMVEHLSQLLVLHQKAELQEQRKIEHLQMELQELFQSLGNAEDKISLLHAENSQLLDSYHLAVQKKRKLEDDLEETMQELQQQNERVARFSQDQEMQRKSLNHLVREMRSPARSSTHASRKHTIRYGDSLSSISEYYYGTPQGWKQIYEANRDLIDPGYTLHEGVELSIP